ncbi:hypothetical protein CR969_00910 [Candidatus Saccharibacteria bacterium]|nr:MAG: hypothetical protein CR969_00910 [Candidatus Saccharibacteria bacterium]
MAKDNIPNTPEMNSPSAKDYPYDLALQDNLQKLAENNLNTKFWTGFIVLRETNGDEMFVAAGISGESPTININFSLNRQVMLSIETKTNESSEVKTIIEHGANEVDLVDWRDIADDESLLPVIRVVANHMDKFANHKEGAGLINKEQLGYLYDNVWDICQRHDKPIIYGFINTYKTDEYGYVTVNSISDLSDPNELDGRYLPNSQKVGHAVGIECDKFVFERTIDNGFAVENIILESLSDENTGMDTKKQQLVIDVLMSAIKSKRN